MNPVIVDLLNGSTVRLNFETRPVAVWEKYYFLIFIAQSLALNNITKVEFTKKEIQENLISPAA